MSLLLYLVVLLVSLSSVVFGVHWISVPKPHYKAAPMQVARNLTAKPVVTPKSNPQAVLRKPLAGKNTFGGTDRPEVTTIPVVSSASPACDIQACAAFYYSFRASDCTYQPNHGPRRLCTKGVPPAHAQDTRALAASSNAQAARAQTPACDIVACKIAYRTFNANDCTYQPSNGPRRLCTKHLPPNLTQELSAQAAASAAYAQAEGARAQTPACDIVACKVAYRTFNANDCTYQPSNGPRRICTKHMPLNLMQGMSAQAAASAADAQAEGARAQTDALQHHRLRSNLPNF